ncbi:MAG: recombination regulator RecX [Pseudomonadota bacterium]|nr:recombination regulator RecX [Pseudomonadota bacterium]
MRTAASAQALSLKGRALRYLAAREHSRAELAAKLARHVEGEDDPDAVARVLDELAAKGFINEARVAESVLHRRASKLGNARVLHELRAKGLPDEVVADAAAQLQTTELARAREAWRRKFGQLPEGAAERARQMRFLAARGFSADVTRRVLGGESDDEA